MVEVKVSSNDRLMFRREGNVDQGREQGAVRWVVDVNDVEDVI